MYVLIVQLFNVAIPKTVCCQTPVSYKRRNRSNFSTFVPMASKESTKESAWARLEKLRPSLEEHAQGHLLRFAADLSEAERTSLADELTSLELGKIANIFKATMADVEGGSKKDDRLEPLEPSICGSTLRDGSRVASWEDSGLEEIGRGKVGGASAVEGEHTRHVSRDHL